MSDSKTKKVAVFISEEQHKRATIKQAHEGSTFQSVLYDGFVRWLDGEVAIAPRLAPAIGEYEEWVSKLLGVLQSDDKECIDAVKSNLVVFSREAKKAQRLANKSKRG